PGMPYTAEYKTTSVHKLANGVTITRSSTYRQARDSEGRTCTEQSLGFGEANINGKFVSVIDPVSHTILHWNTSVPEVNVTHLLSPDEMRAHAESAKAQRTSSAFASGSSTGLMTVRPVQQTEPNHSSMQRESLGSKTINGVVAQGERITITMPVGLIGN